MTITDYFSKDDEIKELKATIKTLNDKVDDINKLRVAETDLYVKKIASVNADRAVMKVKKILAIKSKQTNERKIVNVLKAVIGLRDDGLLDLTNKQIADRYFTTEGNVKTTKLVMKREQK